MDGPTVVISDTVPIDPGPGCVSEDATRVRCSPSHDNVFVVVRAGDGDDSVRLGPGRGGSLRGGPGDDVLRGPPDADNHFLGGRGDDRLVGGSESDHFDEGSARSGSDTMLGGSDESGGLDHDTVDYHARRSSIHADLGGDADDGERGERDRIGSDVEALYSGSGPDRLTGGPGPDTLDGDRGRDVIRGGGGADSLVGDPYVVGGIPRSGDRLAGGPGDDEIEAGTGADTIAAGRGFDRVDAGPGPDRLGLWDGGPDVARCGSGNDAVRQDTDDFLMRGCERRRPRQAPFAMPFIWFDANDTLTLQVACPSGRSRPCEGEVSVDPGPPVPPASKAFALPPGSLAYLYLPLQGRTYENPVPPLGGAVLGVSSTDARGRLVRLRLPLRDLIDGN